MYSERFQKFIEMWQKDFAIERTIDERSVLTVTVIRFLGIHIRQLSICRSLITVKRRFLSSAAAIPLFFGPNGQPKSSALKIIRNGLPNGSGNFNIRSWISAGGTKERFTKRRFLRTAADMT